MAGTIGSILFVCLGNTCRSPMAEGLFRRLLADAGRASDFAIGSAGTKVRQEYSAPDPRAQNAIGAHGIDIGHMRSRSVTAHDIARHDLIVAMDMQCLRDLLNIAPGAEHVKIRLFLDFAPDTGAKEIPDPFHGGPAEYEQALALISAAAKGLLAHLDQTGASSPP